MTDELKPCPFCGEAAELMMPENFDSEDGTVLCMSCFASGPPNDDWRDAIAAWNRSASPDPDKLRALVKEWRKECLEATVFGVKVSPEHAVAAIDAAEEARILEKCADELAAIIGEGE